MAYKLSILICSTFDRSVYFNNLISIIAPQLTDEVEVLHEIDNREITIGDKRNKLIERSKGEYITFVDDDDEVSKDYVKLILKAIESSPDCCSLNGIYTVNDRNPELFCHSIKYNEWKTTNNTIKYERNPNHLNAIKRSIAVKYKFIPVNNGEDQDWSMRIQGELSTEVEIKEIIYHYKYRSNK
jgi:hypothetical protein